MKAPEFDTINKKWDEFQEFHTNKNGSMFVTFEDGGFMIRNYTLRPHMRHEFRSYGFAIMRSNDPMCRGMKFFTPDGERVAAKSLGNCELLWDLDTNKAYSLERMWMPSRYDAATRTQESTIGPNKVDLLPNYLRNHGVRPRFFMHGDGRIVTMPVDYNVWREYTDEQKQYIKTTTNACKAWHALVETKEPKWRWNKAPSPEMMNWKSFGDMDEKERRGIAVWGFTIPIDCKKVSHLVVEPRKA